VARPLDMGESLVGAYLRYGEECDFVVYGTQTEGQGEIDVIGFKIEQRRVWLCEVATHLDGLQYGSGGAAGTLTKVRQKVERAISFSDRMFPGQEKHFEWWSPRAGPSLTVGFESIERELGGETSIEFIVNAEYAKRVAVLVEKAREGTKATPEPFFRSLQILAHLKGAPLHWVDPTHP
jgi:hypothetical protein